jgi:hypothetical protein
METLQSIREKGQALGEEGSYFAAILQKGQEKLIESWAEGFRQLDSFG